MEELLKRLKIDIGILNSTTFDERLMSLLKVARNEVNQFTGASMNIEAEEDAELIIDYASWLWINRRQPTEMPKGLKYRLNCRAFARNAPGGSTND